MSCPNECAGMCPTCCEEPEHNTGDCTACGYEFEGPPDSYWQEQLEAKQSSYEKYAESLVLAGREHLL